MTFPVSASTNISRRTVGWFTQESAVDRKINPGIRKVATREAVSGWLFCHELHLSFSELGHILRERRETGVRDCASVSHLLAREAA
jgi:hypothetical protein